MKNSSLEKMRNFGNVLQREQLKSIIGGTNYRYEAFCTYPDGTGWTGSTLEFSVLQGMHNHCSSGGGTMQLEMIAVD